MYTDIINVIFELFVNFFQGTVFVTYCYKFLTPSRKTFVNRMAYFFAVAMMLLSITLINYLYISFAYIETVIFFAIMIPYSVLFFKDKIFVRILIPLSLNVLYTTLSFGINYFFSAVIDCDYNYLMTESTIYRYIYVILSNMIFLIILFIAYNLLKSRFYMMRKRDVLLSLATPIVSIAIAALTFLVSSNAQMSNLNRLVLGLISILILSFNFLNFYLIKNISGNFELRNENVIANKEKELYKAQIASSEKYMSNISSVKHNIQNQLLCIENLIDEHKYTEARTMCRNIVNDIKANTHFYKTGYEYLDAILNIVNEKTAESNIKFTVNCVDNLNFIDGDDLAVLIGNLADNAIEALAHEEKKELKIEIIQKGVYEILSVQNYCTESVLDTNPELVTNKPDSQNHGFGLTSVKKIVKKYGGDITYCEENNYFFVNIMFEIPNIP